MKEYFGRWAIISLIIAFCVADSGCAKSRRREQIQLEGFTASVLQKFLALSEGHPDQGQLTNVVQIFSIMDLTSAHRAHPYVLQERFKQFGANAGFTNSIYDKYLVLPAGLTNSRIRGELTIISAKPFLDVEGRAVRMVIWKAGRQDYRSTELPEARVQSMFLENRLTIPALQPMLAPKRPSDYVPTSRFTELNVERYFRDMAGDLGIGRGSWWLLLLVTLLGGFILATLIIGFAIRMRSRR